MKKEIQNRKLLIVMMFWDMLLKPSCAHELPDILLKDRFGFKIKKAWTCPFM